MPSLTRIGQIIRVEGLNSLKNKFLDEISKKFNACGGHSFKEFHTFILQNSSFDVYSFDLFDTLLRRKVDPPHVIGYLVAKKIHFLLVDAGVNISIDEVLSYRYQAEKALRHRAYIAGKDPECSLDDLIKEMLRAIKKDTTVCVDYFDIIAYEVELEKELTEPIPGILPILQYLKSLGKRIICVSDTHLSIKQIRTILDRHNLLMYIDRIYSSSEILQTKASGKMFKYVLQNEGCKFFHSGDNYISDYRSPNKLGIVSLWLNDKNELKRRKKISGNNGSDLQLINSILSKDMYSNELYRLGYTIFGPALVTFVSSVIEHAKKDDVERLYFVARDGYGLKRIYDIMQNNVGNEEIVAPSKYLCMSRLSLRLPSLLKLDSSDLRALARKSQKKQILLQDFFTSYGLTSEEFCQIAKRYNLTGNEVIDLLNKDSRIDLLLADFDFKSLIIQKSEEARELFREYLSSIQLKGESKIGLVDLQGEGHCQLLLESILSNGNNKLNIHAYYFNLIGTTCLDLPNGIGLINDWRSSPEKELADFSAFTTIIELFLHPNHGVTVGYRRKQNIVLPVFKETLEQSQYKVTSQVLEGILDFTKNYSQLRARQSFRTSELIIEIRRNIRRWVAFPPKKDVCALEGLFETDSWPDEKNRYLVERLSFSDLVTRRFIFKASLSLWFQGTLRLVPVPGLNWIYFKLKEAPLSYKLLLQLKKRAKNES